MVCELPVRVNQPLLAVLCNLLKRWFGRSQVYYEEDYSALYQRQLISTLLPSSQVSCLDHLDRGGSGIEKLVAEHHDAISAQSRC
jgi:hypothetical protein